MLTCRDGSFPDLLDYIHYVFPNNGTRVLPDQNPSSACWTLTPYHVEALESIVPPSSGIYTSEGLIDSSICFTVSSSALVVIMLLVYFLWGKLDSRFAAVSPNHKKWYVVANMSKCILLAIQCISLKYWVGWWDGFAHDQFRNLEYKRTSILYVITDFVALFMVPKLPTSTILHHVTTVTLSLVVWSVDLQIKGWTGLVGASKMLIVYGSFSTVAFAVNGYLALRVIYPKSVVTSVCCKVALVTYLACCACNWSVQAHWLITIHDFSMFSLVYLLCIAVLAHDDVVLIRWLLAKNSPGNK